MDRSASSVLSLSSSSSSHPSSLFYTPKTYLFNFISPKTSSAAINTRLIFSCPRSWNRSGNTPIILTIEVVADNSAPEPLPNRKDMPLLPKIDKSGRFCSPRAAREFALMILYAACLDGSDPVRLFEKRLNAARESGYEFDKASLMEYDHMSFGGPSVTVETPEEADEILSNDQKESDMEAQVLSAPPKLVYSKLILRFTRKLLVAVVENWDNTVLTIDKVAPPNWKNEPAGRILELSILHLAMSEIAVLGARHQIVISEAVDLAKRFCDGSAPRIINGCLRTFVKELNINGEDQNLRLKQAVAVVGRSQSNREVSRGAFIPTLCTIATRKFPEESKEDELLICNMNGSLTTQVNRWG